MSLIKRMRKQRAVWWKKLGVDVYSVPQFDPPLEIRCRWDDKIGQFQDSKGQTVNSVATVYVDRELDLGDRLKKGSLPSDVALDPMEDPDAHEIVGLESNPNLRAKEFLLTVHL